MRNLNSWFHQELDPATSRKLYQDLPEIRTEPVKLRIFLAFFWWNQSGAVNLSSQDELLTEIRDSSNWIDGTSFSCSVESSSWGWQNHFGLHEEILILGTYLLWARCDRIELLAVSYSFWYTRTDFRLVVGGCPSHFASLWPTPFFGTLHLVRLV